ncbi:hypothetical protein GN330_22935 [Nitratireductor sp. CAU 1489]|uniref:Transmembrane protein n=1 Tax=Nitratireductor arenosus TaxID=2682096 RepID=A0A844QLC4_9HYPH|nr:hypothetical protein [Nitratireductor arenosus]MVB00106.1 hypothetical protein [Nitratireductor arenosus]
MTVSISWWAIPALITAISFSWAFFTPMKPSSDYGFDIMPLFRLGAALIGSLVAWLVWALIF